jgi:hypothetical protein
MDPASSSTHPQAHRTNPAEALAFSSLVREELDRVLASQEFHASKLCQGFLRYIVENTLGGHAANLKERTIGIEVFGKPTSYDPSEDAGVRVKAGEVRKRLRSYYSSHPGQSKVLIDMPSGTYVPEFQLVQPDESGVRAKTRSRTRGYLLSATMGVLVLALSLFFWMRGRSPSGPLNQFWFPVFESHKTALICVAPVPVYTDLETGADEPPPDKRNFTLIPNQFAAISDVNASLGIADMFRRMREPYKLRIGKDVSFGDLQTGPAVLVGFTYTQWHEIGENFRYSIDLSQRPFGIAKNGVLTKWTIKTYPDDPNLDEDYAIVSRFFYPDTNDMVVEITGISHYGTQAATELFTNPTLIQQALRNLPAGWERKNVQIVLHMDVISGFASVPTVVATYSW